MKFDALGTLTSLELGSVEFSGYQKGTLAMLLDYIFVKL